MRFITPGRSLNTFFARVQLFKAGDHVGQQSDVLEGEEVAEGAEDPGGGVAVHHPPVPGRVLLAQVQPAAGVVVPDGQDAPGDGVGPVVAAAAVAGGGGDEEGALLPDLGLVVRSLLQGGDGVGVPVSKYQIIFLVSSAVLKK